MHAQDYFKCNDSSKIRSRGFSAYEDRLAAAPRTPVCPETLPIPVPIIRTGPSSAPLPSFPSELLQPYVSLAAQGPGRRPSLTLEGPASARDVRVPRAYAPRFPHPPGPIPRRPRGPAGPPRGYTAPGPGVVGRLPGGSERPLRFSSVTPHRLWASTAATRSSGLPRTQLARLSVGQGYNSVTREALAWGRALRPAGACGPTYLAEPSLRPAGACGPTFLSPPFHSVKDYGIPRRVACIRFPLRDPSLSPALPVPSSQLTVWSFCGWRLVGSRGVSPAPGRQPAMELP